MHNLAIAIWVFMIVRLLIAAFNVFTRQWLRSGRASDASVISILIPARDEAENIGDLLDSIINQDYPYWEVLVYDDLSVDNTAGIVQSYRKRDKRIRLITGRELPKGWLGKNHACHQLAIHAKGKYFLFVDADVQLEKTHLHDALSHMQNHKLHLLSIFPQQIMKSWGERVSVPVMNWVLVSLLPLILTRKSRLPAFAAANGQHMLFNGNSYRKYLFHKRFRNNSVEDIAIAKYMKQKRLRIHTLLSNGQIKCRMYKSLREALLGFSKNVLAFFGNHVPVAILIMLITSFGAIPVFMVFGAVTAVCYLISAIFLRAITAYLSKQNILINMVASPMLQIVFCVMVIQAIHKKIKRKNKWKGRIIAT